MRFDNDYVNRYRSIPAASSIDEAPYDLLISRDIHPDDSNLYVTLPMHYHPEIEIIYVEYGEWYYRTAVNEFYTRAGENELVVFSAYEPHEAAMRSGIGYKTKCICFDLSLLASLPCTEGRELAALLSHDKLPFIHLSCVKTSALEIEQLFNELLTALDAPSCCEELRFVGTLCLLFSRLIPSAENNWRKIDDSARDLSGRNERGFARLVIDYTEAHYDEPISAKILSSALNYSESYFCRMFRRVFKMSYGDYLRRLRISKVCPLLCTAASVTEAAEACGFSHMSLFSKIFREYTGMTPTEYKRNVSR